MLAIAVAVVGGCDRNNKAAAAPSARVAVSQLHGQGVIEGAVRLEGQPPVMEIIPNQPCHAGAGTLMEETVVASSAGGVQNVFVYLKGAPPADGAGLPAALLDQKDCRFVPHVVGVTVNQPLRFHSSDPTLHNVHLLAKANPSSNFALTSSQAEQSLTFSAPEFIRVKCDVHPWMTAYVAVADNPYYSVTDSKGRFTISNVPAGHYTLVAWQERLGAMEQSINMPDGPAMAFITFTYKAP